MNKTDLGSTLTAMGSMVAAPTTTESNQIAGKFSQQQAYAAYQKKQAEEAEKKRKKGLFGSLGGALGTVGGVLLAPVTGGMSLPIAAGLGGALGNAAGQGLAGGGIDVGQALMNGATSGIGAGMGNMIGGGTFMQAPMKAGAINGIADVGTEGLTSFTQQMSPNYMPALTGAFGGLGGQLMGNPFSQQKDRNNPYGGNSY